MVKIRESVWSGVYGMFIIFSMSIYYQVLAFRHILVQFDDHETFPLDPNSIKLKIFQYGTQTPSITTKLSPQLKENKLQWEQSADFRYRGQKKLAFEIYCIPQEQQNAPPQIIFRGTYYVDTQKSPKKDSCHIYSPQGEKKGLLRWQVSLQKRQEILLKEEQQKIEKPLIPQNLIGVIKISQASFSVSNPIFNKKKHPNPTLVLTFAPQTYSSDCVQEYQWRFQDIKIQYFPQSSQTVELQLFEEGVSLLNGSIACESIRKLKRYLRQEVSMFNKNQIKVGTISLELRYMDKEQLINFVYSPQNNPDFTKRYSPPNKILPPTAIKASPSRQAIMKKNQSFFKESRSKQTPHRYALRNSDVLLPKTSKFMATKTNNHHVSYLDPEKLSPLSPKRKRGWGMSIGRKFDFTRRYRENPGVGTYKLPSIWGEH